MIMKRQQQQKTTYIHETTNNTTHDGLEKEVMHRTWLRIRVWIEIDSKNEHFSIFKMVWHVFAPFSTRISSHSHVYQLLAIYRHCYLFPWISQNKINKKKTHQFKLLWGPLFSMKNHQSAWNNWRWTPQTYWETLQKLFSMEPCYPSSHNPWATSEKWVYLQ